MGSFRQPAATGRSDQSADRSAQHLVLVAGNDCLVFARARKRSPIGGFKHDLISNGQDADVYHHILFTAGNALHGTPAGESENDAFRAWDWKQGRLDKRNESETELRDDDAGIAIGGLMLNTALAGEKGDYWGLKAQIKAILCDF